MIDVRGSTVVSALTIPKFRDSNRSGSIVCVSFGHSASAGVDFECHLGLKVMPSPSEGPLNQDLVRIACTLSHTDFKYLEAHLGR